MKQKLSILAGGLLALCLPLPIFAQSSPAPVVAQPGPNVKFDDITEVIVKNPQGDTLGRIQAIALDLTNGRVVEAIVVWDQTLRLGGKNVAVPPSALTAADNKNEVYTINMSADAFKAAPAFDLSKWNDATTPAQVAASYRYFKQEPYFLVPGEPAPAADTGPHVASLGYVERMKNIINMPVHNLKGETIGYLDSVTMDVPRGLILTAMIKVSLTPNTAARDKSLTVISPKLLSFNDKRDALVVDVTSPEYKDMPKTDVKFGANGEQVSFNQEVAAPVQITAVSDQGKNGNDIKTTEAIFQSIKDAKLAGADKVVVATKAGRVTLTGSAKTQAIKDSIGAIAIAATSAGMVDNQIVVPVSPQASN